MRTLIAIILGAFCTGSAWAQTHTPNYCRNPDGSSLGWRFNPDAPQLNTPVRTLQPLLSGIPGTLCLGMGCCTASTLELTDPELVQNGTQITVGAELARVYYLSPGDCGSAPYLAVPLPPLLAGDYSVSYRFEFTYINALSLPVTETVEFTGSITVGAAPTPIPVFGVQGLLWLIVGVSLFGVWQQRRLA